MKPIFLGVWPIIPDQRLPDHISYIGEKKATRLKLFLRVDRRSDGESSFVGVEAAGDATPRLSPRPSICEGTPASAKIDDSCRSTSLSLTAASHRDRSRSRVVIFWTSVTSLNVASKALLFTRTARKLLRRTKAICLIEFSRLATRLASVSSLSWRISRSRSKSDFNACSLLLRSSQDLRRRSSWDTSSSLSLIIFW